MLKREFEVTLFTKDNYKLALKLVRASGLPYTIERTNYTLKIDSPILKIKYLTNMMSKHPIYLERMILRDIRESKTEKPVILKEDLKFFSFNELEILKQTKGKDIYNIDIKSAYSNVLNNFGLLREPTYKYLSNVSKTDRLAAVGMMASTKDIFVFDGVNKKPISDTTFTKDSECWFWLCVLEIQNVMMELKLMLGADFLYYWVDGLFFTGIENREIIEEYLKEKNYNNSFDKCEGFRFWQNGNVKYLSYWKWKEKDSIFELKQQNLPAMDKEAKDFVIRFCKLIGKENEME